MTNEELTTAIQEIRRNPNATEADKDRARELLATLYQQNTTLIKDIARHYKGFAELDDLMQEGFFGLSAAVDNYDPAAGAQFMTYARHWIRRELALFCETAGRVVRLPAFRVDQVMQYNRAIAEYTAMHGTAPSDDELTRMLDSSADMLRRIRDAASIQTGSLDAPCGSDDSDSITMGDTIADPADSIEDALEDMQNAQLAATLWPLVDTTLSDLQADIIRKSFVDDISIKEIAQQAGVTQAKASNEKQSALRKLSRYRYRLLPFMVDAIAYNEGIRHAGIGAFTRSGESTTERAAFRLLDLREK